MQQFSLCFGKVKKDCLKFIKSQETKADKFKNKERMIKSFLIPLCFWINKKADKKRPYFVGLAGGQGTGKTTISSLIRIILTKYFNLNVFRISIDDFYKTRKERINLSIRVHPMLLTRGVPGTHDTNMMLNFFKKSKSKKFKRLNKDIKIFLADPDGSSLFDHIENGELKSSGSSITEGIGSSRVTANFAKAKIDGAFKVTDKEALPVLFDLIQNEGLSLGTSCAINVTGAIKLGKKLGPGKTIVTILCDRSDKYNSKLFNKKFLQEKGLPVPSWI